MGSVENGYFQLLTIRNFSCQNWNFYDASQLPNDISFDLTDYFPKNKAVRERNDTKSQMCYLYHFPRLNAFRSVNPQSSTIISTLGLKPIYANEKITLSFERNDTLNAVPTFQLFTPNVNEVSYYFQLILDQMKYGTHFNKNN